MVSLRLAEEDINGHEKDSLWIRPEETSPLNDYIACNSFDLGFPEVSEASYSVTEGNGVVDLTRFHGKSTVTMDLTILGSDKATLFERLRAMCHPYKRLWLYVSRPEWSSERRMQLRANSLSFVSDRSAANRWKVSLSFANPSGRMQAVETSSNSTDLVDTSGGIHGIVFPVILPITWPAFSSGSEGSILVRGTAPVLPQIKITGKCTSPRIDFPNVGTTMFFPNLTVEASHFLLIDVPSKQILMDGDLYNSRYNYLAITKSDNWYGWPSLLEGENTVRFSAEYTDGNSSMQITWKDEWL